MGPDMPRKRRPLIFKHTDVVRALKAAHAAGIPNPRVEIDRNGTIAIIPCNPPKGETVSGNDLDNWLSKKGKDAHPA
jgi:hypothetical protein